MISIEANDVKYNTEKYVKPTLQLNLTKFVLIEFPIFLFFFMCYEFLMYVIIPIKKFMEIKYLRCFLIHSWLVLYEYLIKLLLLGNKIQFFFFDFYL